MRGFFVTGTDTHVGKTQAMCALIRHAKRQQQTVLPLKPVASGAIHHSGKWVSEDVLAYEAAIEGPVIHAPWCFEPPIAPHLAASLVNVALRAEDIADWCVMQMKQSPAELCLIEGAGGILVPLNTQQTWLEVIQLLSVPVIVIVGIKLGCLNHALLTEAALIAASCEVAGWIANRLDTDEAACQAMESTLASWMKHPCLGVIPYGSPDYRKINTSQGACCVI